CQSYDSSLRAQLF
nr:immunoglobulin light chain junction region [Macaca mulatta]